jgi:hypothetical protein
MAGRQEARVDFNITIDQMTPEDRREARDARWHWVHDCIELHKESRQREMSEWDYVSMLYNSRDPDSVGSDTTLTYYGVGGDDGGDERFNRNELYAFLDQLVATVCPPNPEITIKARRRPMKNAAKFRQLLINEVFGLENLALKLWRAVGRACIFPRSFLKVSWSPKLKRPKIRVVNPHFVFFDEMASEWEDIRYLCEVRMLTRGEFMSRVKKTARGKGHYNISDEMLQKVNFGDHEQWMRQYDSTGMYVQKNSKTRAAYKWVPVYEFYDFVSGTIYHFVDGVADPVFEAPLPYQLHENPFHMIVFNDNLKNNTGLSDAELVRPTLDLLNDVNTLQLWHIKAGIPIPVIHEGLVDDPDDFASQYRNATGPTDIIRLAAQPRVAINEVLGHTPVATLPVEWDKVTQQMLDVIERVLGLPGFARGQMGETDVATEAALAGSAVRTRNARRQKIIYMAVEWVARAVVNLFTEFMPAKSTIPMQLMDEGPEVSVNRRLLGFGMPNEKGRVEGDGQWDYKFEALAYNGDDDNRIVRLKNIIELLPSLVQNPDVHQRRLWSEVLDLVKLGRVLNTTEEAQQAAQAMQAQMAPPPDAATAGTPAAPDMSAQATTPLGAEFPQLAGGPNPEVPPLMGQGG